MTQQGKGTTGPGLWLDDAGSEAEAMRQQISHSKGAIERVEKARQSATVLQGQIEKGLRQSWRHQRRILRPSRLSVRRIHWQMEASARFKKLLLLLGQMFITLAGIIWLLARIGFIGFLLWQLGRLVLRFIENGGLG